MILINIGSNLSSIYGNRLDNLNKTIDFIKREKIKISKYSGVFETPSYPNNRNPRYLNICLSIISKHKPELLLRKFKDIEKKLLRIKDTKNQPRTCDIDLIDFNGKIFKTKKIVVPHPRAHLRNFVLYPLREICPDWKHPILNKKIDFLINKLNLKLRNEITRLKEDVII